jgi:uncharacterized membrane protein
VHLQLSGASNVTCDIPELAINVTVQELQKKKKICTEKSVRIMLIQEHITNIVTLLYLNQSLKV